MEVICKRSDVSCSAYLLGYNRYLKNDCWDDARGGFRSVSAALDTTQPPIALPWRWRLGLRKTKTSTMWRFWSGRREVEPQAISPGGGNTDLKKKTLLWEGSCVGAPGIEPGTSCTPCKRASRTAPRPVSLSPAIFPGASPWIISRGAGRYYSGI